jgi:phage gp16-like protein
MTCRAQTDQRKADLATIHICKADLALDDDTYRDMLFAVARVRSAADLDAGGRAAVIDHLRGLLRAHTNAPRRDYGRRPHNIGSADRGPLLKKIEALLASHRRPWAYAEALARRIGKRDRLALCGPADLRKIVAALQYDARRHP